MQRTRLDGGIGEQEGEHGRHVRRNHAGALGDAVDGHRHALDLGLARGKLRVSVRGHDGAGGFGDPFRAGIFGKPGEQAREFGRIERLADHPGRGDIHVGFETTGGGCGRFRRELHRVAPAFAGEGIGVAGIDHERSCHAVLEP